MNRTTRNNHFKYTKMSDTFIPPKHKTYISIETQKYKIKDLCEDDYSNSIPIFISNITGIKTCKGEEKFGEFFDYTDIATFKDAIPFERIDTFIYDIFEILDSLVADEDEFLDDYLKIYFIDKKTDECLDFGIQGFWDNDIDDYNWRFTFLDEEDEDPCENCDEEHLHFVFDDEEGEFDD